MKRFLFCFLIAVPCFVFCPRIFAPRAFAQTAAELETLLYADAVSYGQAARFVLLAADISDLRTEEAFRYAMERNWLPAAATQDAAAKLDGVSLLVMQAFNMKGGAFYTMIRTPHYAYRELLYQNIIQGRWTTTSGLAWDFSAVWEWNSATNLPKLRGLGRQCYIITAASRGEPSPLCGSVEYTMPPKA